MIIEKLFKNLQENAEKNNAETIEKILKNCLFEIEAFGEKYQYDTNSSELESVIAETQEILKIFPAFGLLRKNLIEYKNIKGVESFHKLDELKNEEIFYELDELKNEGIIYDPAFNEHKFVYLLYNKVGSFSFEEYLKHFLSEYELIQPKDFFKFLIFHNYFRHHLWQERIDRISENTKIINPKVNFFEIERNPFLKYRRNAYSEYLSLPDSKQSIENLRKYSQDYLHFIKLFETNIEKLPPLISSLEPRIKKIFLESDRIHPFESKDLIEQLEKCNKYVKKVFNEYGDALISTISQMKYVKDIETTLLEFIKRKSDIPKISPSGIMFLNQCIQKNVQPLDLPNAIISYNRLEESEQIKSDSISNLVSYYLRVKKQDDEKLIIYAFCDGGSIEYVIQRIKPRIIQSIIGNKATPATPRERTTVQESVRQSIREILEYNALKVKMGIINYSIFFRNIMDYENGNGKNFFDSVKPLIEPAEYEQVLVFLKAFEADRIPIHEYLNPATTRNSNYECRWMLTNEKREWRTFIKLYTANEKGNSEREKFMLIGPGKAILEKYGVNVPRAITTAKARLLDNSICDALVMSFIDGNTLDEIVNDPILKEKYPNEPFIRSATIELANVHKATPELEAAATKSHVTFFEVFDNYFNDDLKIQLFGNSMEKPRDSKLEPSVRNNLLESTSGIITYLAEESIKDGVYYKDCNSRNTFCFPRNTEKKTSLIDYECGVKILGEVDLMKIMRNGCNFKDWDTSVDYTADEYATKRKIVSEYIETKRYFAREKEIDIIKLYNQTRGKELDKDILKRFHLAALYTHIWYISWFSHKRAEKDISENSRAIIGNRVNYHLLEAKLLTDQLIHDDLPYCPSKDKVEFVQNYKLKELRKVFDSVPIVQNPAS